MITFFNQIGVLPHQSGMMPHMVGNDAPPGASDPLKYFVVFDL